MPQDVMLHAWANVLDLVKTLCMSGRVDRWKDFFFFILRNSDGLSECGKQSESDRGRPGEDSQSALGF